MQPSFLSISERIVLPVATDASPAISCPLLARPRSSQPPLHLLATCYPLAPAACYVSQRRHAVLRAFCCLGCGLLWLLQGCCCLRVHSHSPTSPANAAGRHTFTAASRCGHHCTCWATCVQFHDPLLLAGHCCNRVGPWHRL